MGGSRPFANALEEGMKVRLPLPASPTPLRFALLAPRLRQRAAREGQLRVTCSWGSTNGNKKWKRVASSSKTREESNLPGLPSGENRHLPLCLQGSYKLQGSCLRFGEETHERPTCGVRPNPRPRPCFGVSAVFPVTGGGGHPGAGQRWAPRPL